MRLAKWLWCLMSATHITMLICYTCVCARWLNFYCCTLSAHKCLYRAVLGQSKVSEARKKSLVSKGCQRHGHRV